MSDIAISQAVTQHRAVRAFTEQAGPEALVRETWQLAVNASPGSTIQPWNVSADAGDAVALSKHQKSLAGLALAYTEPHNPLNPLQHPRADVAEFASLRGF